MQAEAERGQLWFLQCPWLNRGRGLEANKCRGHLLLFFLPILGKDGYDKAPKAESTAMLPASFPSAAHAKPACALPPAPAGNLTLGVRISSERETCVPCLQITHSLWCPTELVTPSETCPFSSTSLLSWRLSSLLPPS